MQGIGYGFQIALQPANLVFVFLGVLLGTVIGMIPGLGPISAIALLIPLSYGLDPASGLIMMAGVYYGAIFGGSTSSILLNAPGVAGTVATAFDGYPLAQQGKAGKALAIAAIASFTGGTFSVICLSAIAPMLAVVAVSFGPPEYFGLMVLGLTAVASLADQGLVKALLSALVGLMLASVGIDLQTGIARYTFGIPKLLDGIDFLVVVLGLFALAEVLLLVHRRELTTNLTTRALGSLRLSKEEWKSIGPPVARGSVLGFFAGVLPGAGATIASFMAYAAERRISRQSAQFGKGALPGLAAPEAANNAACGGSFVPLLTLGVPGSGSTAVLLGALLVLGVTPGPLLFQQRPDVFWGVVSSMYVGNIFLLIMNLPLIPMFVRILYIPRPMLMALIFAFCLMGVYLVSFSVFDLWLLILFGVVGFFMRLARFPAAPLILAFVLGDIMEQAMRQSLMISRGDWSIFVNRPIAFTLLILAAASLVWPMLRGLLGALRARPG